MEDLNAKGGSYQRQADGSIKLIDRTEEATPGPVAPAEKQAPAKATKPGKED
jgi:hypothetical protein